MTQSLDALIRAGEGDQDATEIAKGIFMSRGIANTYLLTTKDGDVQVNTGLNFEADEIKKRFDAVRSGPLRKIIFTQGHPDHVYGWSQLNQPGVETIAQRNHADVREYWRTFHAFYFRRIMKLWGQALELADSFEHPPEPVVTTTFLDTHHFELGGRRFELLASPGGEAADALVVWLPAEKTVLIGNLMGPMFGHVPNLYTLRGDKLRGALAFIHSIDRVLALEPETLINGHDVFHGAATIAGTIRKVREAIVSLRDQTRAGMNAGKSLWTLMREVTLPPALLLPQMHGKVPWIVRTIWEEHAGWFRYESTTELYDTPPSAVWPDLIELAGAARLTQRAQEYVAAERPLEALQLSDIVLGQSPDDASARDVRRAALEQLLVASGHENFSEVQWLQDELRKNTPT